jgi:hypothetical protein
MKGKGGNIRFAPCPRHRAMHRFDDVATRRKLSQCLLEAWPQAPAAGRDLFGKAEPFQLGRTADHKAAKFGILYDGCWAKIGNTRAFVDGRAESSVQPSPSFSLNVSFQRRSDFTLAPRSEFQCDALFGPRAKSAADVVATYNEILSIIGASSHQDMHMGIISVPMIDGDPVEPGAKIAFGVRHQFSRKRPQVRHILRVLRRNDEPEVVPVVAASLSEAPFIRLIRACVEHPGVSAIAGDPIPFEIGQMLG